MKITKRLPVKNITNFHPELKNRVEDGVLERKSLVSTFTSLEDGEAIGVISTPSVDNDGDIIDPQGISASIYNGTVQWNHSLDTLPLGTITEFTITPDGVKGKFKFSKTYDFAVDVYNLVKENILKGISIGYIPLKALKRGTSAFNEYAKARGWDVTDCQRIITECLWIETSMVPVGCNNDALILASKAFKSDLTTKAFKIESSIEEKACDENKVIVEDNVENISEKIEDNISEKIEDNSTDLSLEVAPDILIVQEEVNEEVPSQKVSEVDQTLPEGSIPEDIKEVSQEAETEVQITPEVVSAEPEQGEAIVIPEVVEPQPEAPKLALKVLRKGKMIHTEEIKAKALRFLSGKSF